MRKSIYLLSFICLFSCSATKKAANPKATEAKPAEKTATNTPTPSPRIANPALAEGKSLYEQHCGACHKLKNPKDFTEEQLNKVVPNMVAKTNKKAGNEAISAEKQKAILTYLVSACKK